jgi:uncharacterized membrane protein YciS (DUF1049 family)
MKLFQYLLFYPGTLGIAIVAFLVLLAIFCLRCRRHDCRNDIANQYNMIVRYSWKSWTLLAYAWGTAFMLSIILIGVFFFPLLTALSIGLTLTVCVFFVKSLIDYKRKELAGIVVFYLALMAFCPGAVLLSGAWYMEYASTPGYTKGRNIGRVINYSSCSMPLFLEKQNTGQVPKFFLVVTTQKTRKGERRLFGALSTMEYIQSLCVRKLNVTVVFHARPGGGLTQDEIRDLPEVKANPTWDWRYNDRPPKEFNKVFPYGTILFVLDDRNAVLYDVMFGSDQRDKIKKELLVMLRKKYPL